jgi:hypothetical protein
MMNPQTPASFEDSMMNKVLSNLAFLIKVEDSVKRRIENN